jgi:CheY-like chemotaxis protein
MRRLDPTDGLPRETCRTLGRRSFRSGLDGRRDRPAQPHKRWIDATHSVGSSVGTDELHERICAPIRSKLDVGMPHPDGLGVCRRLPGDGDITPILLLSADDMVADRMAGLTAGADDCLVKGFAVQELVARLHALLWARPWRAAGAASAPQRRRQRLCASGGLGRLARAPPRQPWCEIPVPERWE